MKVTWEPIELYRHDLCISSAFILHFKIKKLIDGMWVNGEASIKPINTSGVYSGD